MKIAFCAAIGNVTPILILFNLPELSKPIQNPNFKIFGMEINSVLHEWVTAVVQVVVEKVVDRLCGDAGHDDDVHHVPHAEELSVADEVAVQQPLEDDCNAVVVDHGADAGGRGGAWQFPRTAGRLFGAAIVWAHIIRKAGRGGVARRRSPSQHQVVEEGVERHGGDAGHDDHVRHVPHARELPVADELAVLRPLEHHGDAVLVEHGGDAGAVEAVAEVPGGLHAPLRVFPEPGAALGAQAVPQEDGGVAVAAAGDGGVHGGDVLHVPGDVVDEGFSGNLDAAWHGTS
nr:hypothetical protein Iba_chr08bCG4490 [Ipomoea batatas]